MSNVEYWRIAGSSQTIPASRLDEFKALGYVEGKVNPVTNEGELYLPIEHQNQEANSPGKAKNAAKEMKSFREIFDNLFGRLLTGVGVVAVAAFLVYVLYRNRTTLATIWDNLRGTLPVGNMLDKLDFLSPETSVVLDPKLQRILDAVRVVKYDDAALERQREDMDLVERVANMDYKDVVRLKLALEMINLEKALMFLRIPSDSDFLSRKMESSKLITHVG